MIYFEEAEKIALEKIDSDCVLLPNSITEKPYGWYFNFQSKKFIKTGNISDMVVGNGGFIVEKTNGKVVEFSSVYDLKKNFEIYEKGLTGNRDLVIIKVKDLNYAVRLLYKLRMTYIKHEFAHDVEWKVPQNYNEKQIKIALTNLPHAFENQKFYFMSDVFEEIDKSGCLVYELKKHER